MYPQQKEAYGTRAEYRKRYREEHPEYVQRNTACVKKYRSRRREQEAKPVSSTSRDIFVTVSRNEA